MNFEIIKTAIVAAVVIAYAIERGVKPLVSILEALGAAAINEDATKLREDLVALYHLWPYYVATAIGGWLARYTGLDFLPIFGEAPAVGRILSCGVIGQGPSVLYDLVKQVKDWVGNDAT